MSDGDGITITAGFIDQSPDVAMALGLFVARWSLAEMCLIMPLLSATGASQEVCASILSSTNSAEGKIKLVRTAVAHSLVMHPSIDKSQVDKVLREFIAACNDRNELMHHLWVQRSDGATVTIDYRKSDGSAERSKERGVAHIYALCNRALDIAHRLCAATGSPWVGDAAVSQFTLKPPA